MASKIGFSTSSSQAGDVYNELVLLLQAEGWTLVDTFVVGSFTWYIWRSTAANSGQDIDHHVCIAKATNGTGDLRFTVAETFDAVDNKISRFAPANAINFTAPDAYGLTLHSGTGTKYPTPRTDNTSSNWRTVGGDNTIGVFGITGDTVADSTELAILAAGPPQANPESAYVHKATLPVDDATAVEYILHVTPQMVTAATQRVFNNSIRAIYAGAAEGLTPDLTGKCFVVSDIRQTLGFTTRTRETAFQPPTEVTPFTPRSGGFSVSASTAAYGPGNTNRQPIGKIGTTSANSTADYLWKGPLGHRFGFVHGMTGTLPVDAFYGLILATHLDPDLTAPGKIGFADQITVNGQSHAFVGRLSTPILKGEDQTVDFPSGLWIPNV